MVSEIGDGVEMTLDKFITYLNFNSSSQFFSVIMRLMKDGWMIQLINLSTEYIVTFSVYTSNILYKYYKNRNYKKS